MKSLQENPTDFRDLASLLHVLAKEGMDSDPDFMSPYCADLLAQSLATAGNTLQPAEIRLACECGYLSFRGEARSRLELAQMHDLLGVYTHLARRPHPFCMDTLMFEAANVMCSEGGFPECREQALWLCPSGELTIADEAPVPEARPIGLNTDSDYLETAVEDYCRQIADQLPTVKACADLQRKYDFTFEAYYRLLVLLPWEVANQRMARLVMHWLQYLLQLVPLWPTRQQEHEWLVNAQPPSAPAGEEWVVRVPPSFRAEMYASCYRMLNPHIQRCRRRRAEICNRFSLPSGCGNLPFDGRQIPCDLLTALVYGSRRAVPFDKEQLTRGERYLLMHPMSSMLYSLLLLLRNSALTAKEYARLLRCHPHEVEAMLQAMEDERILAKCEAEGKVEYRVVVTKKKVERTFDELPRYMK